MRVALAIMFLVRTAKSFKSPASLQRTSSTSLKAVTRDTLKAPIDFNEKFFLQPIPPHLLHLQKKNPCALDASIAFDEKTHTYTLNRQPVQYSVTQIVDQFFDKFDGEVVVKRMMSGINWPRPEYMSRDNSRPMTEEEILQKWDRIGLYARNRGTPMVFVLRNDVNPLSRYLDAP